MIPATTFLAPERNTVIAAFFGLLGLQIFEIVAAVYLIRTGYLQGKFAPPTAKQRAAQASPNGQVTQASVTTLA